VTHLALVGTILTTACNRTVWSPESLLPAETPAPVASVPDMFAAAPQPSPVTEKPAVPTFADDLAFLRKHGDVITLEAPTGGVIAVSAQYQGRVMTSAVGPDRIGLGYLNRDFIAAGKTGTQFDNYGGEDRFWLGPEGGQFALYFAPGTPQEFANWQTPAGFQEGAWTVDSRQATAVTFTRSMQITNYAGTTFDLAVKRTARVLDAAAVAELFGETPPDLTDLDWVAYETINEITNTGKQAWTRQTGAPSIWILAMYNPSPDTWVIVPFDPSGKGEIVNDRYFGEVPKTRLKILDEGAVLFKCDGKHRSKIGIGPARVRRFAGSYSASSQLLTLVHIDRPEGATAYVNSMWEHQDEPFGGDVVNSYNDGPVEPGKPALGGFYELETSSPAAFLAPGKSITHSHRTLHFVGNLEKLDPLARKALGIDLETAMTSANE
jgi:hypothetical protein